mmetsp:Transcript_1307/g.5061  ORF Transcript_1307/g.5061 Transcript_1307/m.5061 type:complete len:215 (-) Transcript_1307:74-718(-)
MGSPPWVTGESSLSLVIVCSCLSARTDDHKGNFSLPQPGGEECSSSSAWHCASFPAVGAALSSRLVFKLQIGNAYALRNSLAHVIHSETCRSCSCHGFHFHSGGSSAVDLGFHEDCVVVLFQSQVHTHVTEQQRMAHGYDVRCLLGSLYTSDSCHGQHVSFLNSVLLQSVEGSFAQPHPGSRRRRSPLLIFLTSHVHHGSSSHLVDVGERRKRT